MTSFGARSARRFWVEAVGGVATGVLLVLTLVWSEWIELVFHADPDHGNGALETAIVVACAAATLLLAALARRDRPRAAAAVALER